MRSLQDRLRHALSFELIGLILVTPLAAFAFHMPLFEIGIVSAGSAVVALIWNYIFNWGFDHAVRRLTGSSRKSQALRVLHALLFEVGLLLALMPLIAWYLRIDLWQALVMDAAFAGFYMAYAYIFNLAYDRVFPLAEWKRETA